VFETPMANNNYTVVASGYEATVGTVAMGVSSRTTGGFTITTVSATIVNPQTSQVTIDYVVMGQQ
jgi:hypothetical protein